MTDEEKINNLLLKIDKELKKLSVCMNEGFTRMDERFDRIYGKLSKIEASLKTKLEIFDK